MMQDRLLKKIVYNIGAEELDGDGCTNSLGWGRGLGIL